MCPSFCRNNDLAPGNSEYEKSGETNCTKTLRLDDDRNLDLHKHQRFSLDIDKFLKTEQGAYIVITIGFRPEYSLYQSTDTTKHDGNDEDEGRDDDSYGSNELDDDAEFLGQAMTGTYPFGLQLGKKRNDLVQSNFVL
jgi:hypothetical protein